MSQDQTTLPEAMLDMTKRHCRVNFSDDDEDITEKLAQAIGYAQHFTGLQIFGAEVAFAPAGGEAKYQCPVQPVSAFTAADANGDVTDEYELQSASITEPVWLVRVDGAAIPGGVTFSLIAGHEDPADMDPALRGNIVRIAATLYENRESMAVGSLNYVPSWMNDMLAGLWVPRA